ncbi:hypothetical protein [Mycobacterium marinum]|uniref:hypothetical protein n=1 Tax=Mycobacterium marinum TaxID=1781 RepID=UPI0021C2F3EA|nr:hypothetical protein [Mycobacterium marinum]
MGTVFHLPTRAPRRFSATGTVMSWLQVYDAEPRLRRQSFRDDPRGVSGPADVIMWGNGAPWHRGNTN